MVKSKLFATAVIGFVGIGGLAQASPGYLRDGTGPEIRAQDLPVTVQELVERHARRFSKTDTNGDGRLNTDEIGAALMRMRAERQLQRLDTDGDGAVSKSEYIGPVRRRLEYIDRDRDGQVTPEEMRTMHSRGDEEREHDTDHWNEEE